MTHSFDFAVIRVVPRVERQEFVNAGVVVFCLTEKFLGARVTVAEERLRMLWPELDVEAVRQHLLAFERVCAGEKDAGPIASLGLRERFHWLVAPRSTVLQISPVHSGLCVGASSKLGELFRELVLLPADQISDES